MFPNEQDIEYLKKTVDPNREGSFSMKKFVEVGLQFASKQSEVARNVANLGIKESLQPPEKIVIKDEH